MREWTVYEHGGLRVTAQARSEDREVAVQVVFEYPTSDVHAIVQGLVITPEIALALAPAIERAAEHVLVERYERSRAAADEVTRP